METVPDKPKNYCCVKKEFLDLIRSKGST